MYDGMINVYKEKGFTSHDAVAKMRGILGQKKVGHTGTLDPEAEGVLPVCVGMGTRLCDMMADEDKTYRAVLLLGVTTDTQDMTGTVKSEHETDRLDEETVRQVILSFAGDYDQIPPMYSALKVNGKKLYELAREGKEIERKPRLVKIFGIGIEKMDLPEVTVSVTCSKGTYIRTLCHDIGEKLGTGGCMKALIRTRVGRFELKDSKTLSELEALRDQGRLLEVLTPVEEIFKNLRELRSDGEETDKLIRNGNPFSVPLPPALLFGEEFRVLDSSGRFLGVYGYSEEKRLFYPRKMFLGGN